jgi:hypothetical protein
LNWGEPVFQHGLPEFVVKTPLTGLLVLAEHAPAAAFLRMQQERPI